MYTLKADPQPHEPGFWEHHRTNNPPTFPKQ